MESSLRWDIFCNVVDHFGDIGVSWRLARQLHRFHGMRVRLHVDDLDTFHALCTAIDPHAAVQEVDGITVLRWTRELTYDSVGDVVIDAFGSKAPDPYLELMARRPRPPVWINLEYLSAEDWIEDCHRAPSPHPRLPLVRYFFFPGFSDRTGGLLEEPTLAADRAAFLGSPSDRTAVWESWRAGPPAEPGTPVVSLFGYGGPAVPTLLEAWAGGSEPLCVLVPQGRIVPDVARFFGRASAQAGERFDAGVLDVRILPFRSQDDYDRLLWLSDCNFVRGEDSFVRAQWAERPFVWNIYAQEGGAHWAKLHAFIDRYGAGLEPEVSAAVREFWRLWNRGETSSDVLGKAWRRFWAHAEELRAHNAGWAASQRNHRDLVTNLVRFTVERL